MPRISGLAQHMVIYDFLIADLQVLGQFVFFGQNRQITFLVGGVHPFIDGIETAYAVYDFPYKIVMVHKIVAAQVKDPAFVAVDQVVYLLGKLVVVGNIHYQVGENLHGKIVLDVPLNFLYPWRLVAEHHGDSQNSHFLFGEAKEHVLDLDLQPAIDAVRKGFVVFIGRVFAVGVKNIGRGQKVNLTIVLGYIFDQMLVCLYLSRKIAPERRDDQLWAYLFEYFKNIVFLQVVPEELFVAFKRPSCIKKSSVGVKISAEFFIEGIAQKAASSQDQYFFCSLLHLPFLFRCRI